MLLIVDRFRNSATNMPRETLEEVLHTYVRFVALVGTLARLHIPKLHLMVHLICRSQFLGNPWTYSTWEDESKNKVLKACLQNVAQLAFESACFRRVEVQLRASEKRSMT